MLLSTFGDTIPGSAHPTHMVKVVELEAGEPPIEPGTVFAPVEERDTMEIAIPPDAFDLGISLCLQALTEELTARWFGEFAIDELVSAVRKRVAG